MKALLSRKALLVPIGVGLFYIIDCSFRIIQLRNQGDKKVELDKSLQLIYL